MRAEEFVYQKLDKPKPPRLTESEALGQTMIEAGNDFGPGTNYGEVMQYYYCRCHSTKGSVTRMHSFSYCEFCKGIPVESTSIINITALSGHKMQQVSFLGQWQGVMNKTEASERLQSNTNVTIVLKWAVINHSPLGRECNMKETFYVKLNCIRCATCSHVNHYGYMYLQYLNIDCSIIMYM